MSPEELRVWALGVVESQPRPSEETRQKVAALLRASIDQSDRKKTARKSA